MDRYNNVWYISRNIHTKNQENDLLYRFMNLMVSVKHNTKYRTSISTNNGSVWFNIIRTNKSMTIFYTFAIYDDKKTKFEYMVHNNRLAESSKEYQNAISKKSK